MDHATQEKLLSDRRVVDEIQRHLWIESQKLGHDIGFDQAKEDWLKRFSKAWMEYHMPEALIRVKNPAQHTTDENAKEQAPAKAVKATPAKRRRAKSYIQK